MKTNLPFLLLLVSLTSFAQQYTAIPDANFEKALITQGYDSGTPDYKVLTANINKLTVLDVTGKSIANLTGIQDFTALTVLFCDSNKLTNFDVSKNIALTQISCFSNQLTSLDVSTNIALTRLYCDSNQLTSLDLSKNIALVRLNCSTNKLNYLNLKNTKLNANYLNLASNPNLTCIQVDDVAYSNANWANVKDATATYNTTCASLSTENHVFDKIAIYPIPTQNELHIDNIVLEKAVVYDVLGKLVQTTTFSNGSNNNTINLAGIAKGVYYVYLHSAGATTANNIIVE
jgi:hypothetical protein